MITRTLILKSSKLPTIQHFVRKSPLFSPVVSRFIAGDTLEEALAASNTLLGQGLRSTLDYLGENTHSEAEAREATDMYLKLLSGIRHNPGSNPDEGASPVLTGGPGAVQPILPASEPINISIKLTQCGLDLGQEVCEANLREVLAVAKANQTFVRVDMEASEYTERTLDVIYKVFDQFPCVGTVLQSYLYRTDDDVEALIQRGIRCRLVKGAYLEPAEVAYPEKSKVDEAYVRQAKRLLDDGFYPAIATQDEEIIRELNRYVEEKKIDRSRFEYQMLYGIRRDLQAELFKSGYNVRIYIPFGDSWYPYFTRRLAERPANLAFIARSFLKG